MYDGYYIYSPYTNTWSGQDVPNQESGTYEDDVDLYGLKPYVYYSCRYKTSSIDVTITYSLDNYIEIQGYVSEGGKKKTVSQYGYVLNMATTKNGKGVYIEGDKVYYNGIEITSETPLTENIYVDGELKKNLQYIKENGVKYYFDGSNVFSVINGKSLKDNSKKTKFTSGDDSAKNYYKEAKELYDFMKEYGLLDLTTGNIEDVVTEDTSYYSIGGKIFDYAEDVEAEDSNFNTHRIDVIKNAITKNLSVAISNFNSYSSVTTDFQMPKLKDSDWDKIMDNISVISFFQGMSIGGKIYNGYSIVTNTKNEDVVMEDSIYIKNSNGIYRITEQGLTYDSQTVGIYNVNLEKRTGGSNGETYYLPVEGILSYGSIVTQDNISENYSGNLANYVNSLDNNLKKTYYTALARERYSLYRIQLWIPTNPEEPTQGGVPEEEPTSKVTDFTIPNITFSVGRSGTFGPTLPSGKTFKSISYTVSNSSIAEVRILNANNGAFLITAIGAGTTTLTCTITNYDNTTVTRTSTITITE